MKAAFGQACISWSGWIDKLAETLKWMVTVEINILSVFEEINSSYNNIK